MINDVGVECWKVTCLEDKSCVSEPLIDSNIHNINVSSVKVKYLNDSGQKYD